LTDVLLTNESADLAGALALTLTLTLALAAAFALLEACLIPRV
jgi:hypothetical protein